MNKLETYEDKKKAFPQLFDLNLINKAVKNIPNMKTYLKKTKNKGLAVFAKRNIKKGEIVCYYHTKIFKRMSFDNIFNDTYIICIRDKYGKIVPDLVCDIFENSLLYPTTDGVAYWGYLANEPSKNKDRNCYCISSIENYMFKDDVNEGDCHRYEIKALKNIKKDEEITWDYGDNYKRSYKRSLKKSK